MALFTVTCGVPVAPVNGSVYYTATREGSKTLFQCDNGLIQKGGGVYISVSMCTSNGSWYPSPASLMCAHIPTGTAGTRCYNYSMMHNVHTGISSFLPCCRGRTGLCELQEHQS